MTGGTDTLFTSLDSGVDMILQGDSMANMMVMAMDKDTGVFFCRFQMGSQVWVQRSGEIRRRICTGEFSWTLSMINLKEIAQGVPRNASGALLSESQRTKMASSRRRRSTAFPCRRMTERKASPRTICRLFLLSDGSLPFDTGWLWPKFMYATRGHAGFLYIFNFAVFHGPVLHPFKGTKHFADLYNEPKIQTWGLYSIFH